ncbi:MAG: hypothetical protein H0Z18_06805 [Thermococcus sp.]|uniref:hypothetical protein n=1 Tax=Thermococcus sp. TaxID=35749 RepID=UPI001D8D0361|nr:hypothetical protein [Thermococcus sp.]MBO8174950.1 hypothetical protein [Thermococcus sp.]
MKKRVKNTLFILFSLYFVTSLVMGYIVESWIVGFALSLVFLFVPLIIAYIVSKSHNIRTPYVIGDSNEVVYSTQDELEEILNEKRR